MSDYNLTDDELNQITEYLQKMDDLSQEAVPFVGDDGGDAWKAWTQKEVDLNDQYHDVIVKALTASLDDWKGKQPQSVAEILKTLLSTNVDSKESLTTIKNQLASITRYGLMKDKASRALISRQPEQRELDGQLSLFWNVDQSPENRPQVPVYMALSYQGTQAITDRRLTGDDDAVFTAISNMIIIQKQNGIMPPYDFSAAQIWREMNGITDTRKSPTKKQAKEICDSIDKMRFTRLYMDISNEMTAGYVTIDNERVKNGVADENYITANKRRVTTVKGKEIDVYRFYDTPFLYEYNISKGHIVLVDYNLLDTTDTTGNEGNTSAIRKYLLIEIALMYEGSRDSNKILYSTLYQNGGVPSPKDRIDRRKYSTDDSYKAVIKRTTANDRKKIMAILDSWVNKKWILGYKQIQKGRAYTGVEIKLNPKNYNKGRLQDKKSSKVSNKKK